MPVECRKRDGLAEFVGQLMSRGEVDGIHAAESVFPND
jgi:hypothetical protein